MQVERRKYRFRILGVGISRSWNFSLDSGEPMAVIATDGGLMPAPQYVTSFRAASSERYEVIIDFSKHPIGKRVVLHHKSNKNNRDYTNTKGSIRGRRSARGRRRSVGARYALDGRRAW